MSEKTTPNKPWHILFMLVWTSGMCSGLWLSDRSLLGYAIAMFLALLGAITCWGYEKYV